MKPLQFTLAALFAVCLLLVAAPVALAQDAPAEPTPIGDHQLVELETVTTHYELRDVDGEAIWRIGVERDAARSIERIDFTRVSDGKRWGFRDVDDDTADALHQVAQMIAAIRARE